MTDPTERPTGPFFVNDDCIDCDLCHETAPTLFARDEDQGKSVVIRAPETPEELELYREAAEACPVEAIREEE